MENIIKAYKEQSAELVKALEKKRNACIGKQDAIRDMWHSTEQDIRYMEDNTDVLDVDRYDRMCDNTHLYSDINQRIEWQLDAINAMERALEEIDAGLEELDYQNIQIRLHEGSVK